jgi:hypothetical protein
MSVWKTTYNKILKNEGGYNRPVGSSGETYKGIDRKYNGSWNGWAIIDKIKAQRGKTGIRENEKFNSNTQLENLVAQFYKEYINRFVNIEAIQNQTAADMVADFIFHKQYDAIKVINATAQAIAGLYPPIVSNNSITADIVTLANNRLKSFYEALYNNRIRYYQNPRNFQGTTAPVFSAAYVKAFINRVKAFPSKLYDGIADWFSSLFKK